MSDVPSGLCATRWSSQILSYSVRLIAKSPVSQGVLVVWGHKPAVPAGSSGSLTAAPGLFGRAVVGLPLPGFAGPANLVTALQPEQKGREHKNASRKDQHRGP